MSTFTTIRNDNNNDDDNDNDNDNDNDSMIVNISHSIHVITSITSIMTIYK